MKVLVVIADKRSTSGDRDVTNALKVLNDVDIRVIPVSLGIEADEDELRKATQNPRNLIEATESEKPEVLGDRIMGKVLSGKLH